LTPTGRKLQVEIYADSADWHAAAGEEANLVIAPQWFQEGTAHNTAWKLWTDLARLNPYIISAVNHLIETRGWAAFARFFAATRTCQRFEAAFTAAFDTSPEAFESEYAGRVQAARNEQAQEVIRQGDATTA
jgi:hypothetical protein